MFVVTPWAHNMHTHAVARPILTATLQAVTRSRCLIACEYPDKKKIGIVRRIFLIVFLLSFAPYFMPYEQRPEIYSDGLTREQIADKKRNRALGMDLSKVPFD